MRNIIQCMSGTQLQRSIELKIRKLKDKKMALETLGDDTSMIEAGKCQMKIRQLSNRYTELCNISGLPPKRERMQVIRKTA